MGRHPAYQPHGGIWGHRSEAGPARCRAGSGRHRAGADARRNEQAPVERSAQANKTAGIGDSDEPVANRAAVRPSTAVGLTLAAGLLGLLTNRSARALGWRFPSTGYLVGELIWNAGTLGLLFWAIRHVTRERIDSGNLGLSGRPHRRSPYPVGLAVVVGAVATVAAIVSSTSATNASTYGRVHHVGLALGLAEIIVRYPLTVIAEEALFRGWMQPRLGRNGPVLSALLWAGYHLQQVATIPSLVIFGLVLGFIRWHRGNVRGTGVLHYCSDAIFFLFNYW